jgi:hypothetical protein
MKMLVTAVALATLIASPAMAQTASRQQASAEKAYAQVPGKASPRQVRRGHSVNPAHDVFDAHGSYVGSDPDGRVRSMLRTDPFPGSDD